MFFSSDFFDKKNYKNQLDIKKRVNSAESWPTRPSSPGSGPETVKPLSNAFQMYGKSSAMSATRLFKEPIFDS
jgi:hypothetical protein